MPHRFFLQRKLKAALIVQGRGGDLSGADISTFPGFIRKELPSYKNPAPHGASCVRVTATSGVFFPLTLLSFRQWEAWSMEHDLQGGCEGSWAYDGWSSTSCLLRQNKFNVKLPKYLCIKKIKKVCLVHYCLIRVGQDRDVKVERNFSSLWCFDAGVSFDENSRALGRLNKNVTFKPAPNEGG